MHNKIIQIGNKSLDLFTSSNVSWRQGFIKFQRAKWHSCMQWGWPSLNRGEHLIEWCDYWVFTIKIGTRGVCLHYYPYAPRYKKKKRLA